MSIFNRKKDSGRELKKTVEHLENERDKLKEEVADLKLKHKIEVENIKHLTKLKEEKDALTAEKLQVRLEGEKDKAIAEVKDEYRDKMETQLATERDNIKDMYEKILERLPNISVKGQLK